MSKQVAINILNEFFKRPFYGFDQDSFVYRISPEEVLPLLKQFGSSRKGLSDKVWDRLDLHPSIAEQKGCILHQDVIIASTYLDLVEDAQLENGTFLHKLSIYKNPLICVYDRRKLEYLCDESKNGPQNTGKNWLFIADSREALVGAWMIANLDLKNGSFEIVKVL